MNRDLGRGTDTLQQASSSSYLAYLFLVSAAVVVMLPYLLPLGGSLLRSNKKGSVAEKIKEDRLKASELYSYPSFSSDVIVSRNYMHESRLDNLEMQVIDLQRKIQIERERTYQLEYEIRILHLSERFLKERVQSLEERRHEYRRDVFAGSVPVDLLVQKTADGQSRQNNMDMYVQELRRMLQVERERTDKLVMEINVLRMSESILVDRVKTLEDKFNAFLSREGQMKHYDSKYEQKDY
eukprot:c14887_g1_i1 orf=906-1622(+)